MYLLVSLRWVRNRVRDLLAQQLAIPLPHAVDSHLHRGFT